MLVADEPTGNVDPDMADRLLHLFDSLNKLGTTVVVATHDFHLLGRIAGRADDAAGQGAAARPDRRAALPAGADRADDDALIRRANARVLDEAGGLRAMTWVMAIMLFLTVLAAALGLGTRSAGIALERQLAGRLTVQIVEGDPVAPRCGGGADR